MKYACKKSAGIVVAPHHLAAEAGARILGEGGNAIEAMIAAAAAITVVYPHMNSLGGDNFILIGDGAMPFAIDACGAAARKADVSFYRDRELDDIPSRGPLAALTVAGAVSGWQMALEKSKRRGGKIPLPRLFEDAIKYAREGVPVTGTLNRNLSEKFNELKDTSGFSDTFLINGTIPKVGQNLKFPALANTLDYLSRVGLDDFYQGDVGETIASELVSCGSPLRIEDFRRHSSLGVKPLSISLKCGTVYTMPPPTQGLASMMILGLIDRMPVFRSESYGHIHTIVEATKQAFKVRDKYISDPKYMTIDPLEFLSGDVLDDMADQIDPNHALSWPVPGPRGDTVWLGAIDRDGCAVSLIQSIYWEFGSGLVLPSTGVVWQNRGTSFGLGSGKTNSLIPFRRPFHTIHPAMAKLKDGRTMVYGTMGGEGQPQTQAEIFTRYVQFGQGLEESISAPRWLLGRTWGEETSKLRLENRFEQLVFDKLIDAGHDIEIVGSFEEMMGHAGAVVRHNDSLVEGASDPRCDGAAIIEIT